MSNDFRSIGEVLLFLKNNDITNVDERAEIIQAFEEKENKSTGNAHSRYLENGASTYMNVITDRPGTQKECILWCINHYLSLNRNPNVIEKACAALRRFGSGCGTSAVSCGMNTLHRVY